MAGVIADRQKDRLVLAFGLGEGLFSPRVPVDGVVGVQEQVRTLFVDQAVGVLAVALGISRWGGSRFIPSSSRVLVARNSGTSTNGHSHKHSAE